MAGVKYCLSAIGSGSSAATINQQVNASHGLIENISNVVATVPLENFGPSDGVWCADTACFEDIENANQICAIFIHECDAGKILDWQSPVQGHSCPDGQLCIDLTCFKIRGECSPKPDPIEECEHPCVTCDRIRKCILEAAKGATASWSNNGKSTSFVKADIPELRKELTYYRRLCDQARCIPKRSRRLPYRPPCTTGFRSR